GAARNRIARLNSDGSLVSTFNPGLGFNGVVNTILAQSDGRYFVGGAFTSYNGFGENRVARLNSDGSLDTTINFGLGADNFISSSLIQNFDGKYVVGGAFDQFNGFACSGITRIGGGNN